jgi:3',5'-nucleoside bisphosphate phosphatase
MRGRFDLHLHTTASDGLLSPGELVARAKADGLVCIAVTDHDTTAGVGQARACGARLGLPVIAGAELAAEYHTELHILGYGMDIGSSAWQAFAAEQQKRRAERNRIMLGRIKELGLDLSEEFLPENVPGEYGRMHMALGLVQAGHAQSVQQAFDCYLGHGAAAYVKRRKFGSAELISAIKAAGGCAVLAHPGRMQAGREELKRLVCELEAQGLIGIEAFYPLHDVEETRFYAKLAGDAGMICTYGSDWHGFNEEGPAAGFEDFSIPDETYAWLDDLVWRIGGAR